MNQYPKFLSSKPKVLGLSMSDLGIIVAVLILAIIFSIPNEVVLMLSVALIFLSKLIYKYIDIKALFLNPKTQTILSDLAKKDLNDHSL